MYHGHICGGQNNPVHHSSLTKLFESVSTSVYAKLAALQALGNSLLSTFHLAIEPLLVLQLQSSTLGFTCCHPSAVINTKSNLGRN